MVLSVVFQLITMVILMSFGYILRKRQYLSEAGVKGLSAVLTKVAVPALLITLMQREFSYSLLYEFGTACLATIIVSAIITIIFFAGGKLLKLDFPQLGLFSGCGAYSNFAFMGQPLILAMFGEAGMPYCVAVIFMGNVYFFTVCSVLFTYKCGKPRSKAKMAKDAIFNFVTISALIGFLLFVFSISLPSPILNALQAASNTTTALSMIIIGSLLATAHIKEVLKDKLIYVFCFLCLVVTPIITKLVLSPFLDGMMLSVIVILMATPAAAALPAFVEGYGNDGQKASEIVFFSTLLSVFTLPVVALFLC